MYEIDYLVLSNAILSLLLILSEFLGWSSCKPNSVSEYLFSLLKGYKCVGRSDTEEQA
jgi:hypothetical protein